MTDHTSNEYRGYRIDVTPKLDCEDRWDFDYTLTPLDGKGEVRRRSHTVNGQMTEDAARVAAIEVARTEVDNVIAMQGG
ncbi:MAG TPA: hypothetical protein VFU95_10410 [Telluria sp.]|nr:hypothetical protein [Telluria sp.]